MTSSAPSAAPLDMGEAILRSLVDAMARRDTVAFVAFYAALSPEVDATLRVADPDLAGALTESVFVHAWHLAPARTPGEPVRAWLAAITAQYADAGASPQWLAHAGREFRRLLCRAEVAAERLRADQLSRH